MTVFLFYLNSFLISASGLLNREEWVKQKDGMEFVEAPPQLPASNIDPQSIPLMSDWVILLRYGAIVALAIVLIYAIVRLILNKTKKNAEEKISTVAEINIKNELPTALSPIENLWEAFNHAKTNHLYREATQILHQIVIKHLDRLGKVNVEIDKTNREYVIELKWYEKSHLFSHLTLLHEYIWYGEREVNQATFAQTEAQFLDFIHALEDGE